MKHLQVRRRPDERVVGEQVYILHELQVRSIVLAYPTVWLSKSRWNTRGPRLGFVGGSRDILEVVGLDKLLPSRASRLRLVR